MTPQQMIDFDCRREAVLRQQFKTNKNARAIRSERRVAFAAGVVRYVAAVAVLLFFVKAFVITQSGADGYAQIVAPLMAQLPEQGFLARIVAPDAWSMMLADTLSGWMAQAPVAENALQAPAPAVPDAG